MQINGPEITNQSRPGMGWLEGARDYQAHLCLAALGLAGAIILWFNMPWGIGVGYDSVYYLSAAENLLKGAGLGRFDGFGNFLPLTHFPPFYPICVAAFSLITRLDVVVSAQVLSVVLLGVIIYLTGYLVFRYTHSLLAGVLGALLALFSPVVLGVHLMAMSEPLYLALLLTAFLVLDRYLAEEETASLLGAAILAGLAFLTRYVGLSAVATGGLALLCLSRRSFWRRVKDGLAFGIISLVPMFAWYWRNLALVGSATNRTFELHPLTRTQIVKALGTVSLWLLPARVPAVLRAVFVAGLALALAAIAVAWFSRLYHHPEEVSVRSGAGRFALLLVGHAGIYLLMLGVSLSFFDASTRLNDRILSPVYLTGLVVVLILLWNGLPLERSGWLKAGVTLACYGLICIFAYRSYGLLAEMRQNGKGFTGREWQASALVAAVRELPADQLIYTNESLPVSFLTGRGVNSIPEKVDVVKGRSVQDYAAQVDAMRQQIVASDGALVVFKASLASATYAPLGQLAAGFRLLKDTSDGSIYVRP